MKTKVYKLGERPLQPEPQTLVRTEEERAADRSRIFRMTMRMAASGSVTGEYLLGKLLMEGTGIEKDERSGKAWLEMAAVHGEPRAMYELAECYVFGRATGESEPEKAMEWYKKAAASGNREAEFRLGQLLVDKDPNMAMMHFGIAVSGGPEENRFMDECYWWISELFRRNGDDENARHFLEQAKAFGVDPEQGHGKMIERMQQIRAEYMNVI